MKHCCAAPVAAPDDQRRVLRLVLWINAAMFLIECGMGLTVRSTSLMADSVDMLGDALVYGFSLYVIRRGSEWQARAALLKGLVMAAFGVGVLAEVVSKLLGHVVPSAPVMGGIGLLALVANLVCLDILWRRSSTTSTCARPGSAPGTTCWPTAAFCWPRRASGSPARRGRTSSSGSRSRRCSAPRRSRSSGTPFAPGGSYRLPRRPDR
jgi:Co/Zn/Cd efflux system component